MCSLSERCFGFLFALLLSFASIAHRRVGLFYSLSLTHTRRGAHSLGFLTIVDRSISGRFAGFFTLAFKNVEGLAAAADMSDLILLVPFVVVRHGAVFSCEDFWLACPRKTRRVAAFVQILWYWITGWVY